MSVFSGVVTLYQIFGNRFFRFFFHNLSWLFVILGFFLTWHLLTPSIRAKLNSTDLRNNDLYLIFLTANAVLIVMVTSLRYFYKDTLLKFDKVHEIVNTVRDYILKLPEVSLSDEKRKHTEYFIENSREDFEFLQNPNESLGIFSLKAHITSIILIFLSTAWAVLDTPFNALSCDPSAPGFWSEHRFVIGYFLVALSLITITLHGVIYLLLLILRKYVSGSLK